MKKHRITLLYFTLLYFTLLYFTLLYFTLLYFTLLYFTLPAQEPPLWLLHKNVKFPDARFISAVGSGYSDTEAKDNAVSQLSLYFNSSVTVNTQASSFIAETDVVNKSRSVSSQITVESEADLPLLSFTETFFSSGKYSICAFIDKKAASEVLAAELSSSIQKAANTLNNYKNSNASISSFSQLSKLKNSLINLEKKCRTLTVLDSDLGKSYFNSLSSIENECNAGIKKIKPQLAFNVKIENDPDEIITSALNEILENEGFVCSSNASLLVSGKITVSKSENAVGVFARPSLSLKILNSKGESLYSYSRQYKKWGHNDFESACRKAYTEVEKDLRSNFMLIFK